ncbi:MAG: toxin TcdB middle/N-terminal domain-containing protein [Limisphaerales bacterium]
MHRFRPRLSDLCCLAFAATALFGVQTWAADKSGVSPNSISVPSGPGSIEGLGESFQPTLNTGTAKHAVGLRMPPGVAGHQPGLSLRYDGGGANGPLGYGWSLPLPSIQRRTDQGIPTYGQDVGFPRSDRFINESKEELVPQADGFWFCKNEGDFVRYRQVGEYWVGTLPDGTTLEFGRSAAGRIEDPSTARVFGWLLERETDTHGNVIEYAYQSFPGSAHQKYLATVRYGPGAPPWTHFHFAAFEYEDRPDWFEDGRPGFLVRTGKRLKSIVVGTQGVALDGHLAGDFDGDGTADHLNRRYELAYLRYAGTNSHWSLLEKVTLIGADGVSALPPATFGYAVSDPPAEISALNRVVGAIDEPLAVMDNPLVDLVDLNADGLPDILRTEQGGGSHTAWINRGPVEGPDGPAIQWAPPLAVDPGEGAAWNFDLASPQTHLADMDGDGLADLVHRSADDTVFYFANQGRVAWSERRDMALEERAPPAPFGSTDVRTADVDFDKRIDIIQSLDVGGAVAYRIWFNLGRQSYSTPITVESVGGFDFGVAGVQLADCNGDRVPDVARVQTGGVMAAAGLGYGRFAAPVAMALPDFTLDDTQAAKAKLTDLNGDGLADLVLERAEPGTCWYWLNLGNYTFSPRKLITDLPAVFSAETVVRWADLNGNGTTDLVYADSQATPRLQAIDLGELLAGGLTPNTLTRIDNGIGRVTRIEYAPSTRFALEDAAAGQPWPDPLPFPVTVVARMTVSDSLGHEYETRFRYHDGYYDPAEKQFRGFARVEQVETGDASAPTLVSRSHFDTGRLFESMKGRLLRFALEQEDGKIFTEESTAWVAPPRILMTGTNGEAVHYVHPVGSVRQIRELEPGEVRRLESEFAFDSYGNQTLLADYGIVEGTNRAAFHDERITRTGFALNLEAWILRLPRQQEIADGEGRVISRSESFYDDETFSGANLGVVTIGDLTLRRDWITPSEATAFVASSRTKYDRQGNPIALFDPLADAGSPVAGGHFRELAYDPDFHSYPVRETIHVGGGKPPLVFEAAYDQGLALVTTGIGFNDQSTEYGYDALGRLTRVIKPEDTRDLPTTEYDYALAVPVGELGMVNHVETRALDQTPGSAPSRREHYLISRQYLDGLGRPLMTRSEAEPAAGSTAPRVAVSGAVLFNARQKPARTLNPFFTRRTGSIEELLAFEAIAAPDWQGQFHQDGNLVSLDLASAHSSTTRYDATLRAVETRNPDGSTGRTVYEPLTIRAYDENDNDPASTHTATPRIQFSDGLGRLIRVDEVARLNDDGTPAEAPATWTTRYEYEVNDQLTRITDSQNNVKVMAYDGLKRNTFVNDPDRGFSTNRYDDASNLIETVDAKAQRLTFTYDGVNRLLTEDFHDEASPNFSYQRTPDIEYRYDEGAGEIAQGDGTRATSRNTKGVLAYVMDASGEEHSSYDVRGRVEWSVKRIPDAGRNRPARIHGPDEWVSYRTGFDYDSLDRVRRMTYPDNDQVSYLYNARSLLERIDGGPGGSLVRAMSYLPSGQSAHIDYGNGVQTRNHYDSRLRLSRLVTDHLPTASTLIDLGYVFDGVSNLQAIRDQRSVATLPGLDPRRNSQAFTYDDLYRLTGVDYNASSLAPSTNFVRYRYDRLGNLLAQTSDIIHLEKGLSVTHLGTFSYGGIAGSQDRMGRPLDAPPGPHALTEVRNADSQVRTFPYDANGNMTRIDGLACTWDFKNRLVAVEDESLRAEYTYDYADRRITKQVWSKDPSPSLPVSVTYVGKHFEIREHGQPTKYVFSGQTRVARVTGSLAATPRIQRLRLQPGWNLCAVAVGGSTLGDRAEGQGTDGETAAYQWHEATLGWLPLSAEETLSAGAVLWIKARTNSVLTLTGTYLDPTNRVVAPGGSFLAGAGLETLPLRSELAGGITELSISHFDAFRQSWEIRFPALALRDPAFPDLVAPGEPVFVHAATATEIEVPDTALRVRYYHQDHLGSSTVITDAQGALVEETAYYPYGVPRHEHQLRQVEEAYGFTQKERDRESGLHYFEARFLSAALSRFASPDPKYAQPDALSAQDLTSFLSQPQRLNLYAYALGNPVRYNDPSGLDGVDTTSTAADVVGLTAAAADEVAILGFIRPGGAGQLSNVAGKAATVVSLGIKAGQFFHDPSMETGMQLGYEGTKTAIGVAVPPVGIILAVLDLTGYGPSAIIEHTHRSIRANRESQRLYQQTAKTYTQIAEQYRQAEKTGRARLTQIEGKLEVLNQKTERLKQTRQKELQYLNRQIHAAERQNRALKAQLRQLEKANADNNP